MGLAIEELTKKQFSHALSYRDRIRLALEAYGEREIHITTDELASKTGLSVLTTYQALYGMSRAGEIELLRESTGAKEKIVGVKLIKMDIPEVIYNRAADKATEDSEQSFQGAVLGKLPALLDYLHAKLAIEEAREILIKAGLSSDAVEFEENPLGEEAIFLLQRLTETTEILNNTRFERDAAQRNYEFLKKKESSYA